jgi:hypothetical protein
LAHGIILCHAEIAKIESRDDRPPSACTRSSPAL